MNRDVKHIIIKEAGWFLAIVATSAVVEWSIIELLDLHPVLSVKVQGFIGLLVIGVTIRFVARIRSAFRTHPEHPQEGSESLE